MLRRPSPPAGLHKTSWVVDAEQPFGGPSNRFPISAATPIAWPSTTLASSPWTTKRPLPHPRQRHRLVVADRIHRPIPPAHPAQPLRQDCYFGFMSSGNVNTSLEQARALLPAADTGAVAGATAGAHDAGCDSGDFHPPTGSIRIFLAGPAARAHGSGCPALPAVSAAHNKSPVAAASARTAASKRCFMEVERRDRYPITSAHGHCFVRRCLCKLARIDAGPSPPCRCPTL